MPSDKLKKKNIINHTKRLHGRGQTGRSEAIEAGGDRWEYVVVQNLQVIKINWEGKTLFLNKLKYELTVSACRLKEEGEKKRHVPVGTESKFHVIVEIVFIEMNKLQMLIIKSTK